jgi:FKBP-type peptidyl-prolyl cis-trans isomerase (trigger factor)
MRREFKYNLQRHGIEVPELNHEAEEKIMQRAIDNVKASIILGAIARKEGIKAEDEEIEDKLTEISRSVRVPLEKIRELYEKNNMIEELEARLIEDKVLRFLIEKSNIEEVSQGES